MSTSVQCPCCKKELYTTQHIEGPYFGKVSGPPLEQDSKGAYMVCPHCECRVDFIGSGQLHLSPAQPCAKHETNNV